MLNFAQNLELVRALVPLVAVIHVGAGKGTPTAGLWQSLSPALALMVEADPSQAEVLAAVAATHPGWSVEHVLLGASDAATVPFYVNSNHGASGCIAAEALHALWPNLRTIEALTLPQRRLEGYLDARHPELASRANWLVVECLPALPVLAGAGACLERMDLVLVRAVLDPTVLDLDGASQADLVAFLVPLGFRLIASIEALHPALGDLVFVRDWRGVLEPRLQDLQADLSAQASDLETANSAVKRLRIKLAREREEMAGVVAALTQEHETQAGLAAGRLAQIDTLTRERDEKVRVVATLTQECDTQASLAIARLAQIATLTREREDQAAAITALRHYRDVQATLMVERQEHIQHLTRERDEHAKVITALRQYRDVQAELATERLAQFDTLTAERDGQATLIATLTQERDTQARLAVERLAHIDTLTAERDGQATLIATLTQERDTQARLAVEHRAHIDTLTAERDGQAILITTLTQERDAQAGLAVEHLAHVDTLTAERDGQGTLIATLTRERDTQIGLAAERLAQIHTLTTERDEQVRLNAERKAQIGALHTEREALLALATQRDGQIDRLTQECSMQASLLERERAQRLEEVASLRLIGERVAQERDEQHRCRQTAERALESSRRLLEAEQRRAEHLQQQVNQTQLRQRLTDEEMTRAESQIDLIKDLLLLDPAP